MPGPFIRQHLSACTEASFQEVVQIFRHDVVLYSGMLLSWAVLFDAETGDEASPTFKQETSNFQRMTQQFHDDARSRLYADFPKMNDPHECQKMVFVAWDQFHEVFVRFARPRLDTLEREMKAYIAAPEFKTIIQQQLGAAATHEAIDHLLLQSYIKMNALLDSDYFDHRVRQALDGKASTV